jgi:hypothetical protein
LISLELINPEQISIWTEDIPRRFTELLRASNPLNIYISTPWISEFENKLIDLRSILKKKNASTIILTRPPRDKNTESNLLRIKQETRSRIYVNSRLHAKLFVIEGSSQKFIVIGSSNFTQEARFNIELAVVIKNSDIITKRVIYTFLAYLKPECKIW